MSKKPSPRSQHSSGTAELQKTLEQGNQLLQNKKYKKALALCERQLATMPDNPYVLSLAGIASELNRQPDIAIDYFRRAVASAPNEATLHYNLAKSLKQTGNIQEAISTYQHALNLAPDNQAILLNFGNLYLGEAQPDAAIPLFQKLLQINPGHIKALRGLGAALRLDGQFEAAKNCFLNAHELNPEDSNVLIDLGDIYHRLDEPAKAEHVYREAIKSDPNNATLISNLGLVLNKQGQYTEALEHYRQAIAVAPDCAQAYKFLAYAKKNDIHDTDIRAMERLLKSNKLDTMQRANLNYGLGRVYENLCDYEKSFAYYKEANDLKRSTLKYDPNSDQQFIDNIISVFTHTFFERLQGCGYSEPGQIFIVGMPRSGTTLVEQIISCHPDVHGAGELLHINNIMSSYFGKQLNSSFLDNMAQVDCKALATLGANYHKLVSHYSSTARYITDKMPQNFLYIGMIHLMLPKAKIIHCMRDPIDTCLSCYTNDFGEGHWYSYTLNELGTYYRLYDKLMHHWQQFPQLNIINSSYEALITDQEGQTRRLLDACGLEWNDACLDFHKSSRPVMTASVNQVREKIYNKSVQRWKHFESHLTPLIDALNKPLPAGQNDV